MSAPGTQTANERELLERARDGDEGAFEALIEPFRRQLHAHCYRMLGSVQDAEDALQETMLRAWRGLARFEGRSSLRSWLYRIATNACLTAIDKRPKRTLPVDRNPATDMADGIGEPVVESIWIEPYPDEELGVEDGQAAPEARYEERESVELAFVATLQHLPARQRAALIMREVLGFSAREVASTLESSTASVNSALQRARASIDDRLPERSQQQTLRALGDPRMREIVDAYIDAMQRGDVNGVVSMLTEDAAWSMPPLASWFRGPDVGPFLAGGPLSGRWRWRRVPARANGQLAVAAYTWIEEAESFQPFALDVLTLDGERIADVTAFICRTTVASSPDHFADWPSQPTDPAAVEAYFGRFGLPERLD